MTTEDRLTDAIDDHARGYLLPKVMYAWKQVRNGDPLKDFLDQNDEIEVYELVCRIGKALGLKAKRMD